MISYFTIVSLYYISIYKYNVMLYCNAFSVVEYIKFIINIVFNLYILSALLIIPVACLIDWFVFNVWLKEAIRKIPGTFDNAIDSILYNL
jgi:hypothetical protein